MMILVTGTSSSGKSAIAEQFACKLAEQSQIAKQQSAEQLCASKQQSAEKPEAVLRYIATMQVYDSESRERVERHRRLRAGKGFTTIERYHSVGVLPVSKKDVCLLECMSNLLANELYDTAERLEQAEQMEQSTQMEQTERVEQSAQMKQAALVETLDAAAGIIGDIKQLSGNCGHLVVVTNEVFTDGTAYDNSCMEYIEQLGRINRALGQMAEVVVESVAGIPVFIKGSPQMIG